jgi:hypothetical protein
MSNGAAAGAAVDVQGVQASAIAVEPPAARVVADDVMPSALPVEHSVIETMKGLLDLSNKVLERKRVIRELDAKKVEDETNVAKSQEDIDKHKSAVALLKAEIQKHEKDSAEVESECRVKKKRLHETTKLLTSQTAVLVSEKEEFGKLTLEV